MHVCSSIPDSDMKVGDSEFRTTYWRDPVIDSRVDVLSDRCADAISMYLLVKYRLMVHMMVL